MCITWLDTVWVQSLELRCDGLHLLRGAPRDGPFQVGRIILHDVLGAELAGVPGWAQEDQVILRVGRHSGWGGQL